MSETPDDTGSKAGDKGARTWFEQPDIVRLVVKALAVLGGLLVVADFWIHKHGPFAIEHSFAFYAWYSFLAGVVLVLGAAVMRAIVSRSEDYYDR